MNTASAFWGQTWARHPSLVLGLGFSCVSHLSPLSSSSSKSFHSPMTRTMSLPLWGPSWWLQPVSETSAQGAEFSLAVSVSSLWRQVSYPFPGVRFLFLAAALCLLTMSRLLNSLDFTTLLDVLLRSPESRLIAFLDSYITFCSWSETLAPFCLQLPWRSHTDLIDATLKVFLACLCHFMCTLSPSFLPQDHGFSSPQLAVPAQTRNSTVVYSAA